jgi:hypothetical protein
VQPEQPPHGASASPVAALVDRDAGQPSGHGSVAIEALERRMRRDEGLLHKVERLVCIGHAGADQPVEPLAMSAHDFGERVVVPRDRSAGKVAVAKQT